MTDTPAHQSTDRLEEAKEFFASIATPMMLVVLLAWAGYHAAVAFHSGQWRAEICTMASELPFYQGPDKECRRLLGHAL